jgi:hypothetical protein
LPVQQSTRVDLTINMKAAKALGPAPTHSRGPGGHRPFTIGAVAGAVKDGSRTLLPPS